MNEMVLRLLVNFSNFFRCFCIIIWGLGWVLRVDEVIEVCINIICIKNVKSWIWKYGVW